MAYRIDTKKCVGCGKCADECPMGAIGPDGTGKYKIDPDKCIECGTCQYVCEHDAPEPEYC